MTNEKSPLKGFRSIGLNRIASQNPSSSNLPKENIPILESHDTLLETDSKAIFNRIQNAVIEVSCPNCGTQNNKSNQKCFVCGVELSAAKTNVTHDTSMSCPACGRDNPSHDKFCGFCGAILNATSTHCQINTVTSQQNFINRQEISQPIQQPFMSKFDGNQTDVHQNQKQIANPKFPTVSKTEFKNTLKTGKMGFISFPILIIVIAFLVSGGLILMAIADELDINGLTEFGGIMIVLGLLLHAISGFIGLGRLFLKGWTLEVLGCMLIGGGSPILFPVMFGILFYVFAEILPNKRK